MGMKHYIVKDGGGRFGYWAAFPGNKMVWTQALEGAVKMNKTDARKAQRIARAHCILAVLEFVA